MEIQNFFHMNGGQDEKSYAKNSSFQKHVISVVSPVVAEALYQLFDNSNTQLHESVGIADLGCSSGPNSLLVVTSIVNGIESLCSQKGIVFPELRVALNDLITNDFNQIFSSYLPEFYEKLGKYKEKCFISAVGGSFYGRLFAKNSLHFVHSSFSLHWLSQVPEGLKGKGKEILNEGKAYISDTSPEIVFEAYLAQFESDFYGFLRARSEELVPGGKMVLYFVGRKTSRPTVEGDDKYELLSLALMSMASEGLIEKENIDSYNAPYYAPSVDEVKKVIQEEGSFYGDKVDVVALNWEHELAKGSKGSTIAKIMRAANESMLISHFGSEVMDELFSRLSKLIEESSPRSSYVTIISLSKKIDRNGS